MAQVIESGTPVNRTDTGSVSLVPGTLLGFYVNSTTSGTIVIGNGSGAAGTALSGTITPAIGFHRFPAYCTVGCYVTIGNTLNVTLFFAAG
jgi:fucose permease